MRYTYFEKAVESIVGDVKNGQDICEYLKERYILDSSMYLLFMFSKDEEVNNYTQYYMSYVLWKERASGYVVVSPYDEVLEQAKKQDVYNFQVQYVRCTKQEAYDISRYCVEFPNTHREQKILINGSFDKIDDRYKTLLGYHGLSKQDYVARVVFRLRELPSENDMMLAQTVECCQYKFIDWKNMGEEVTKIYEKSLPFPENIDVELERLLHRGVIQKSDPLILFSVTKTSEYIIQKLSDYNVIAILDNNVENSGRCVEGIPVYTPTEFLCGEHREDYRIIVPTRSYIQICEQLNYLGYELGKQVFVTFQQYVGMKWWVEDFDIYMQDIEMGYHYYKSLREKYPEKKLYICPYPGTGDVYLIGMYLKERLKYDACTDCVLVVTSGSCKRILSLFELEKEIAGVVVLDGVKEANKLIGFARGIGYEQTNIAVLNNDYGLLDLRYIYGCRGLDFHTLFQKAIFHAKEQLRDVQLRGENADTIFEQYDLREGKTVLLSPYANTAADIPMSAWEELATDLKAHGYDVCTNVSSESELPVTGTKGVFIPYAKLLDFLNKAGGFIGLRSGLCDIISTTTAKKVILYPPGITFFYSSYYDYFSLERMGLAEKDLLEIEFEEECMDKNIEKIKNWF